MKSESFPAALPSDTNEGFDLLQKKMTALTKGEIFMPFNGGQIRIQVMDLEESGRQNNDTTRNPQDTRFTIFRDTAKDSVGAVTASYVPEKEPFKARLSVTVQDGTSVQAQAVYLREDFSVNDATRLLNELLNAAHGMAGSFVAETRSKEPELSSEEATLLLDQILEGRYRQKPLKVTGIQNRIRSLFKNQLPK